MFYTHFIDFYRAKFTILNLAQIISIHLYMLCCNIKVKHAKLKYLDLSHGHLDSTSAQVWPIIAELSNTAANGRSGFVIDSWNPTYTHGKPINMMCNVWNFLFHESRFKNKQIAKIMAKTKIIKRGANTAPPEAQASTSTADTAMGTQGSTNPKVATEYVKTQNNQTLIEIEFSKTILC